MPKKPQSFSSSERLRKKRDFKLASDEGQRCVLRRIVIIYRKNPGKAARLGLSVSKELGNAIRRNRLKRMIREYFRKEKSRFIGFDLHVIVRPPRQKSLLDLVEDEVLLDLTRFELRAK